MNSTVLRMSVVCITTSPKSWSVCVQTTSSLHFYFGVCWIWYCAKTAKRVPTHQTVADFLHFHDFFYGSLHFVYSISNVIISLAFWAAECSSLHPHLPRACQSNSSIVDKVWSNGLTYFQYMRRPIYLFFIYLHWIPYFQHTYLSVSPYLTWNFLIYQSAHKIQYTHTKNFVGFIQDFK